MSHARPGDPVRLGTCIGWGQEPELRWGRLVGIVHHAVPAIHRYVVRVYVAGDGDWPTGGYRTTSGIGLIPHMPDGPCVEDDMVHFTGWTAS